MLLQRTVDLGRQLLGAFFLGDEAQGLPLQPVDLGFSAAEGGRRQRIGARLPHRKHVGAVFRTAQISRALPVPTSISPHGCCRNSTAATRFPTSNSTLRNLMLPSPFFGNRARFPR